MEKFAGRPMQSLPVVDSSRSRKVAEMITRVAVMNRYHQAISATTVGGGHEARALSHET